MPNEQDTNDPSKENSLIGQPSSPPPPSPPITPPEVTNVPDPGEGTISVFQGSFYSGPLPPPVVLNDYNKVCPGTAQVIIDAFDRQSKHRQRIEQKEVEIFDRNSKCGMWFAFIIGMTAIISGLVIGNLYGAAVVVGTIATLAAAFFRGSRRTEEHKTEEKKNDEKQLNLPFPPDTS